MTQTPTSHQGQLPPQANDHYLGLTGANIMGTKAARATEALLRQTTTARAIACIHGDVGLGKTFAAHNALRRIAPHAVLRLQFDAGTNMSEIRGSLWRGLGLPGDPPGNADTSKEQMRHALTEDFRILLIDETQLLSRTALEYIRALWDHPDTQLAVVLVGSGNTRQKILNLKALHSRILAWQQFSPLTPQEVLTTIPAYHPIWADAPSELVLWADDHICHGNFRQWAKLTFHIQAQMQADPKLKLSIELLRWALSQLDPTARFPRRD